MLGIVACVYAVLVVIGMILMYIVIDIGRDHVFLQVNGEFKTVSKGITPYLWCFLVGPFGAAILLGFIVGVECGCNGEAFVKDEE